MSNSLLECINSTVNGAQHSRLAEFDEVLVGGPRWQASDIQVGLTKLLCSSLAAAVGARAGRSHGMRGWSIGLLKKNHERKELTQPIAAKLMKKVRRMKCGIKPFERKNPRRSCEKYIVFEEKGRCCDISMPAQL